MIPKNRIHLSRSLHAQTTPYPNAYRWLKRGVVVIVIALAVGIYALTRPGRPGSAPPDNKQILGEQEAQDALLGAAEYGVYRVKQGDTLFNLSQKYGVSWQTLAEINNLQEPYVLKISQNLKVPQQ